MQRTLTSKAERKSKLGWSKDAMSWIRWTTKALLALSFIVPATANYGCGSKEKQNTVTQAAFVASKACAGCHAKEYEAWKGSHHDLAMQEASDITVLGNFNYCRGQRRAARRSRRWSGEIQKRAHRRRRIGEDHPIGPFRSGESGGDPGSKKNSSTTPGRALTNFLFLYILFLGALFSLSHGFLCVGVCRAIRRLSEAPRLTSFSQLTMITPARSRFFGAPFNRLGVDYGNDPYREDHRARV